MPGPVVSAIFFFALAATSVPATTEPGVPAPVAEASGLSAADVIVLADEALAQRRATDARVLLSALLSDRNMDVRHEAAFRLGKIEADSGDLRSAALRYRRILDERPDAQPVRLEFAALLAKMGDENAARRELRYARAGGLPPDVAQLVDRFSQTLRNSKPFGGSIQLGTSADSNINRATRSDTLGTVIGDFTLDADAKEHSGYGVSIDSQVYGRLPFGRHQFTVTFSQSTDVYGQKRFNDVSTALTAGPEIFFGPSRLNLSAGITRRWFGGDRLTDGQVAQAILSVPVSSTAQTRLALTASKVTNHFNPLESGRNYSAGIEIEKALSLRTGMSLSLSLLRQDLRDEGYSNRSGQLGLVGYRSFGRTTLVASASINRLVADQRLLLYPEKRNDWTKRLALGATFRKLEVYGFSPSAQFSWERNGSSIEIYDYRRRALEFGVARAF